MVRAGGSDEVAERLRRHAGLEDVTQPTNYSVSSSIRWDGAVDSNLHAALADVIDVLAQLNLELNGERPSNSVEGASSIRRDVVYAVAEIVRLLRDARGSGDQIVVISDGVWSIETAWRAILAGDIDDIHEHLVEEQRARRS